MKLVALFALLACVALAQDAPAVETPAVETKVLPLGIPCEPGESPYGPGFPMQCPPVEEQGVMVLLRTSDEAAPAYKAKLRYTTADGEQKEAEQVIPRNKEGEWTVAVFQIGRIKTERLSGNTVDGVDAEVTM